MDETAPKCDCEKAENEEATSDDSKSDSVLRCCVKQRNWSLLKSECFTDICFIVGYEPDIKRINAHKGVLSVGSSVFETMFGKNWSAEANEIEVPDIEPGPFLSMLRFIYTDDVQLTGDSVMKTLYAAKKYAVHSLESRCCEFLKELLCPKNAFSFLIQAKLLDEQKLVDSCWEAIDEYPEEAFMSDSFTNIDLLLLRSVLERDTLKTCEVVVFEAVLRWSVAECQRKSLPVNAENQNSVLDGALSLVRFPLMSGSEFTSSVLPFDLLSKNEIVEMLQYFYNIPGTSCSFISNPRSSKQPSVADRFDNYSEEDEGEWTYKVGSQNDGIGFRFDRNVRLVGFGLHHPYGGSGEVYEVDITVKNLDSGDILHQGPAKRKKNSRNYIFRVFLEHSVKLAANTSYGVITKMRGPDSLYGVDPVPEVSIKDEKRDRTIRVTFKSIDYEGSAERTDVTRGQIPQVLFYW